MIEKIEEELMELKLMMKEVENFLVKVEKDISKVKSEIKNG